MITTAIVLLALSIGVCIGFILCSVLMVSGEEQRRTEHAMLADGSPLEPDSLP